MSEDEERNAATRDAIERWATAVVDAGSHLANAEMTLLQRRVLATVHNLAVTISKDLDGEVGPTEIATVERVCNAWEPRTDTERIAAGHRLIRIHAEQVGIKHLIGASPDYVANSLIAHLQMEVHRDFAALKTGAVKAELARYTATKDRRGGKLTAAGIFVNLNALAGYPFSRSLKSVHVTNAVAEMR